MTDARDPGGRAAAVSLRLERDARPAPAGGVEHAVRALLDDLVASEPEIGTGLGLMDGAGDLPAWSPAAVAGRLSRLDAHERRLRGFVAAAERDEAIDAFAALLIVRRRRRDLELRRVAARRPALYLEVLNGLFPLVVRELGTPAERLAALESRLAGVPALLEEARGNLEPGLPAASVDFALDLAAGLLDLTGRTVRDFAAAAGRPGALDGVSLAAGAALESYRDFLRDELLPVASADCAAGRAVIEDVLLWEHVLTETPEELAEYGRHVLAETKFRMEEVAAELGFADAAAAVTAVQDDVPALDDLVPAYRRAVDEARRFIAARDIVTLPPGEELEVVATPAFLRSVLPYAAYYQPGLFEERQLGFYYVTPPPPGLSGEDLAQALRNHPLASLPTTGVHEAYPGHHVQLVSANLAPTTARRVASLFNGGNLLIEGWAFYCEELMEREGLLARPEVRLMRLNDQVWRACRVVIDVELHLGHMDLEDAARFLAGEAHANLADSRLECRRYAEEPGQAMSYLLGKRELLRLADAHRERGQGGRRDFHDEVLRWGSLPPAVIAWGMGLGPRPAAARVSS